MMAPHHDQPDRDALVASFATSSRALLGVAIRSVNVAAPTVTVTQHRALVLLEGGVCRTVGALASQLGVDPSNASRLCDRLEKGGLIQRQRSEDDRRAVTLRLTPDGHDVLRAVHTTRCEELARIFGDHTTEDMAEVATVMRRFADQAERVERSTVGAR